MRKFLRVLSLVVLYQLPLRELAFFSVTGGSVNVMHESGLTEVEEEWNPPNSG